MRKRVDYQMKQYKRGIWRMLGMVLLMSCLWGCASGSGNEILLEDDADFGRTSDGTILTFFGFKADAVNLIAIEKALGGFMEENPELYVTYEGIKGTAYWEAFERRVDTGNMDDLVMIDHDRILALSDRGQLADLSGLATLDNYLPWAKKQFTGEDGAVYFLPTCISTYNLYINQDLLKQHGQKLPENLEEFAGVCDYFAGQGITPVIANNYASLPTLIMAKGMYPVYSAGDSDAQIEKFNRGEADLLEQLRPGMELVEQMKERGWLDGEEVLLTNQTSDDLAEFSEGRRPFMITGGWASPRLDVDFSYGIYPYPILEDGSVLAMGVDTCISLNVESGHLEETKKLVEYLTQPDVMWDYCESQSSFSPLTDSRTPSDETIAPSAPYLTNGRSVLRSDYKLNFALESALRECGNRMMEGMGVEEAMQLLSALLYADETVEDMP